MVYELFFTNLPQHAFTACDVVESYLHRGAFEPVLSDEDIEQDPDRWCSHAAWGQECWQLISQWVWNLRLEVGHQLEPTPVRTTEFAAALLDLSSQAATCAAPSAPASGYGPPTTATSFKTGRFTGADFSLQPDGTLRCPAGQSLVAHERRREADGSLRVVYGGSLRRCRPCPLRKPRQWQGSATAKPRQVSVRLASARCRFRTAPATRDWSRREHRRTCLRLVRDQRVEVNLSPMSPSIEARPINPHVILSRAQRAHTRLSWEMRLARPRTKRHCWTGHHQADREFPTTSRAISA